MKKVLFTLAALLSLGFAANAGNLHPGEYLPDAPTIVFGDLEGNEITEITLAPGESQELSFILKQMNSTMISGFGIQWRMFDASHNPINYAADAVVQCAKVYGSRTKFWFNPVGIGTNDASQGGYNGVSLANATPYDNVYRILATNTVENMIFFAETEDGQPTCPAVFGHYTVQVAEGWTDDFATFELDTNYSLFNSCPDYDPNDYWESVYPADLDMKLTIKNANATPPTPQQVADPVVTFSEEGDVLTVSWTCETEGATLVIGENEYALPYTYTVDRTYEDQVINGTAYAKKDGMENSNEVPFNYTFTAMTQPTAAEPVITFTEDANGVTINVENATEFTVTVDGTQVYPTRDGSYYVAKVYDRAQAIEVYAKNDPGYPYVATEKTATYTLDVKAKADVNAPTISWETNDDAVVVTVTPDPATDGDLVYDGQYSYPRLESDYEVTVTAYTEASESCNASEPTTVTFIVPAYVPPTPVETMTFVKVTSADQLVAGKKYIFVCEGYAMGAAATGNFLTPIAITAGDEVEVTNDVAILTLGGTTGAYTFELNGNYLLGANGTGLSFGEDANNAKWVLNNNNGALDGYRARNAQYDTRSIKKHNTMERFGHYANSDVNSTFALLYVEKSDVPVLQDLQGQIVVSEPDENGVVTVTYNGPEDVTIMVNGEEVAESYQLEDGVPMTFDVTVSAPGYNDLTASETRTWTKPAPVAWADPVIVVDDAVSEDGFLYATITWEEGGELYIDGEQIVGVSSPYRYRIAAQALYDQEGAFFTQVKGGERPASNNIRTGWNLPAREATYAPTPILNWDDVNFIMTATLPTRADHEIVMKKNGEVCDNPCQVEQTYVEQTITFTAYTKKNGEDYDSPVATLVVTVPAKQKQDSEMPVITVTPGDDSYTISADPCTQLLIDGVEETNPYTVNRPEVGEEDLVIYVTAINNDGEGYNDATATQRVVIPAKEAPVTEVGAPTFNGYTIDGITGYGVYITPSTPGSSIKYRVFTYNEATGEYDIPVTDGWMDYTGTEGEIYYTDMGGKYRVEAYAFIGDVQSDPVSYEFVVHVPTGINEMMGGKTIANQRFFNLAGQEMQEANGVTIVVTTYTDGTTSAVKVMK